MILCGDAQPVHACIQGQMNLYWCSAGGQGTPVGLIRHRLGKMPAPQKRDLLRRGVAQDQDCSPDTVCSQRDAFRQAGHGEGPYPLVPKPFGG